MAEEKKLEQTKHSFKLRGVITRLDSSNAVKTGETGNHKPYKRLSFGVKTSELNEIFVELFGMEKDKVFAYNQKEQKSLQLDWNKRHNVPEGYQIIGVRVNPGEESEAEYLTEMDAVEKILENFKDGDSVYIGGDLVINAYTNNNGDKIKSIRYQIRSISKLKNDLDFDSENFKETNAFESTIVYINGEKADNEFVITGRHISHDETFEDYTYVVDLNKFKKLASNIKKNLKFGDVIKLKGHCWNHVITEELDDTDDGDDWGGEDPNGIDVITRHEAKLEVTNVDTKSWVKGKYKEEDFLPFDTEDPFDNDDDFDPFASDDEDDIFG
ncbi:MAG: hypothetical protein IRZ03_19235 [Acidobacterium ailaaui]|nr:hypothetical protein [Pseudacidobacterium ailaaui]